MEPLSRDTLARLPLRGLLAFAAKCARRVQPIFLEWNSGCGSAALAHAVDAAIVYAETLARGEKEAHELSWDGERIQAAAFRAANAARLTNAFHVENAAESAGYAALACLAATDVVQSMGGIAPGRLAAAVVNNAWEAGQRMVWAYKMHAEQDAARTTAEADFNEVLALNLGTFPQLGKVASLPQEDKPQADTPKEDDPKPADDPRETFPDPAGDGTDGLPPGRRYDGTGPKKPYPISGKD